MKANFQGLFELTYSVLFSCFDYVPLSLKCAQWYQDIVSIKKSISFFPGLLKLDYYCICFFTLLFEQTPNAHLFRGAVWSSKYWKMVVCAAIPVTLLSITNILLIDVIVILFIFNSIGERFIPITLSISSEEKNEEVLFILCFFFLFSL